MFSSYESNTYKDKNQNNLNGIAIYENNEVYNVKEYEEGILGVLCDKDDENRKHSNYANVKAAMFCMRIVGIF